MHLTIYKRRVHVEYTGPSKDNGGKATYHAPEYNVTVSHENVMEAYEQFREKLHEVVR